MVGVVADSLQLLRWARPHRSRQGPGARSWRDWGEIGKHRETADP